MGHTLNRIVLLDNIPELRAKIRQDVDKLLTYSKFFLSLSGLRFQRFSDDIQRGCH